MTNAPRPARPSAEPPPFAVEHRPASWLEIDLDRLEANLHAMQATLEPGCGVCAVVKADAYGLGAAAVAKRLIHAGVKMLAVFSPDQAVDLIAQGLLHPTLMLMPVTDEVRDPALAPLLKAGLLHVNALNGQQLERLDRAATELGVVLPVHVYADTGMSRGGVAPGHAVELARWTLGKPHLRLAGLHTHFASADDDPTLTDQQSQRLQEAVDSLGDTLPADVLVHEANTCGALRGTGRGRSMVRLGLALCGYGPNLLSPAPQRPSPSLLPVVRWMSRLTSIDEYPRGSGVGYNLTRRLRRKSRLGLIATGYADGYPLSLSNRAVVRVQTGGGTAEAPLIGKVNMDQLVVDLTDLRDAAVGDPVELIGRDPVGPTSLAHLASLAGSSCYEMLCRLSPRLPRFYGPGPSAVD